MLQTGKRATQPFFKASTSNKTSFFYNMAVHQFINHRSATPPPPKSIIFPPHIRPHPRLKTEINKTQTANQIKARTAAKPGGNQKQQQTKNTKESECKITDTADVHCICPAAVYTDDDACCC
jgi:hypothetical protein